MITNFKTKRPKTPLTDEEIAIALNMYAGEELAAENSVVFERISEKTVNNQYELFNLGDLTMRMLRDETLAFFATDTTLVDIRQRLSH